MRVKWAWARLFTSLVTNGENVDFVFTFYYGKVQVYTKLERMVEQSITYSSPVSNNCQFMLKTFSFTPPLTLLPTHRSFYSNSQTQFSYQYFSIIGT